MKNDLHTWLKRQIEHAKKWQEKYTFNQIGNTENEENELQYVNGKLQAFKDMAWELQFLDLHRM